MVKPRVKQPANSKYSTVEIMKSLYENIGPTKCLWHRKDFKSQRWY